MGLLMLRGYLPEFLAAIFFSVLLLVGYSLRGQPGPLRTPHPTPRVLARFLLELEGPPGRLRVDNQGKVSGRHQGQLNLTELTDLREAVSRLRPVNTRGAWKVRFYHATGAHEVAFERAAAPAEVARVLENLKILGFLEEEN